MTLEEYLRWEERRPWRYEFVGGYAYALAGATGGHNLVAGNVHYELRTAARGHPCRIYQEGMKLRVGDDVYYPDVMVVCDPGGDDEQMAHAPCLLVEVLSPSTTRTDRTQKLAAYRSIASLRAYLIVSREHRHVERHWRDGTGAWHVEDLLDRGEIPLPCPGAGAVLTLDAIYRYIAFPAPRRIRRVKEGAAAGTG